MSNQFVMISPDGKFARVRTVSGHVSNKDQLTTTDNLNQATVFTATDGLADIKLLAVQQGFTRIPATVTRIVTLGEQP